MTTMSGTDPRLHQVNRELVCSGFRQMLPVAAFVVVFGAAFGAAAVQRGLSVGWAVVMSTAVFAGAAQFAVLDLWGSQIPLIALVLTVFAVNARHLLMGASLYPWLRHLPPARRYGVLTPASDANWAMAMQAIDRGQPGLGLLFGGGLALWAAWVVGTWLGAFFGSAIADPKRWGLDLVMGCFLLAMTVAGPKNVRTVTIWGVAALSSLLAYRFIGHNSHVVVGAIAGGLAGALWMEKEE